MRALVHVATVAVLVVVAALSSTACVSFHLKATTEIGGPIGAPSLPAYAGEPQVWIGSAPAGVVNANGLVHVAPEASGDMELVGRTRVHVEREPSVPIAFAGTACGLVVCFPAAIGWWFYYLLTPAPDPEHDAEAKAQVVTMLKDEARKSGADSVVLVEIGNFPDGSVAHGFLLRHKTGASPPPDPTSKARDALWRRKAY